MKRGPKPEPEKPVRTRRRRTQAEIEAAKVAEQALVVASSNTLPATTPDEPAIPAYMAAAAALLTNDVAKIHSALMRIIENDDDKSKHVVLAKLIDKLYPTFHKADKVGGEKQQQVNIQIIAPNANQPRVVTVEPKEVRE